MGGAPILRATDAACGQGTTAEPRARLLLSRGNHSLVAPLKIDTIERHGSLILVVHGELDLASAGLLDQALVDARATAATRIEVDLAAVSFIDSTGLQVLIRHACATENQARICVSRASRQAQRLFEISGALDYLPFGAE